MAQHTAPIALAEELDAAGVHYEMIAHVRTTTARAEATALGVDPGEVAKTIVVGTPEGLVRTVLPASRRLDLRKVRDVLGTERAELLDEAALAGAYPEFELGAVPPIGGSQHDRVLVDRSVAAYDAVLVEAGTHDRSLRIAPSDLVAHASAVVADICFD